MSDRYSDLLNFLKSHDIPCSDCNPCDCGCQCANSLEPLNGDASFRRYYRLKMDESKFRELAERALQGSVSIGESLVQGSHIKPNYAAFTGSVIIMDAPPETQKNREFFVINRALAHSKVLVPAILACDIDKGFMVLEDLGDRDLLKAMPDGKEPAYYLKSLVELTKIGCMPFSQEQAAAISSKREAAAASDGSMAQIIPSYAFDERDFKTMAELPAFDNDFMQMEMGIFTEWLLDKTLHLSLSTQEQTMLHDAFNFISEQCLQQPQRAMHRDFHCRNIMVVTPGGGEDSILSRFALIDYQDMVKGPIGYDIASLIFDCYNVIEDWLREAAVAHAHRVYSAAAIIDPDKISVQDLDRMTIICAIERHIKVMGLFNRLNLRDGKSSYLNDLPRVLNYLITNCALFPELAAFKAFLEAKIQPHYALV